MNTNNQMQTFSLAPKTFEQAMQYAKLIADSDLAPKDYKGKPANVLIAIQMGHEIGLQPMQAIQNIAVINGRPCLWGDAILALVINHPDYEYHKEEIVGAYPNDDCTAICEIKLKDRPIFVCHFSVADAKKAQLFAKSGPWQQYPTRMLQLRARGFCARDAVPDILKGLRSAEEERDAYSATEAVYQVVEEEKAKIGTPLSLGSTIDTSIVYQQLDKINNSMAIDDLKSNYMDAMKELATDKIAIDKVVESKNKRYIELKNMEKSAEKEAKDISEHADFIQALGDE